MNFAKVVFLSKGIRTVLGKGINFAKVTRVDAATKVDSGRKSSSSLLLSSLELSDAKVYEP